MLALPERLPKLVNFNVRAMEVARGILSTSGAKIVMTTAVDDIKEVTRCFRELCNAYLVKPVDPAQLLRHMRSFQLVPPGEAPATIS